MSDYLEFVRTLPCCITGAPADDAHHIIAAGLGGIMGGKQSDLLVIPLTRGEHQRLHRNVKAWEAELGPQCYYLMRTLLLAERAGWELINTREWEAYA